MLEDLSETESPNKPVLPTATTRLDEDPLGPPRRQTGQSLDRRAAAHRDSRGKTRARADNRATKQHTETIGQQAKGLAM